MKAPKFSNANRFSTSRTVILHYWKQGYRNAAEIARLTKIAERTVYYNIAKIKEQDSVGRRRGGGRPRKISEESNIAIGQWVRRNNEITAQEIAEKLSRERNLNVSRWTVQRQLHRLGYKSVLPRATPMLTDAHKEARVQWARHHLNDN